MVTVLPELPLGMGAGVPTCRLPSPSRKNRGRSKGRALPGLVPRVP